jgi:hypothetical protein
MSLLVDEVLWLFRDHDTLTLPEPAFQTSKLGKEDVKVYLNNFDRILLTEVRVASCNSIGYVISPDVPGPLTFVDLVTRMAPDMRDNRC